MAIATDASSLTSSGGYSNSLTIPHTVAGADRLLLVGVHCRSAVADVTGVTFNGVSMTLEGSNENTGVVGVQWYSLVAPATGTHDVVVSLGGYKLFSVVVYSLTGVDQTTPIEATDFSATNLDGYGPGLSWSITTLTNNARIVTLAATKDDASPFTAGSGATVLQSADDADGSLGSTALQIKDAATAGSNAYALDWTVSTNWRAGTLAIKPKAGATVYTLTAANGTYSQTGVAAALRALRKLISAQGTYAQTGVAAGLKPVYKVPATQGAYALTGVAVTLRVIRKLVSAQGTYAQTGVAATFRNVRALSAATGAYNQTGVAAALRRPVTTFAADKGTYDQIGKDILFTVYSFGDFGEYFKILPERQRFYGGFNDFVRLSVLTEQQEFAVSIEKQYFTVQGRGRS